MTAADNPALRERGTKAPESCAFPTLDGSPPWTVGQWRSSSGRKPRYSPACPFVRDLKSSHMREVNSTGLRWVPACTTGSSRFFETPSHQELMSAFRGRTIVFVGDSLANEERLSLLALLLCNGSKSSGQPFTCHTSMDSASTPCDHASVVHLPLANITVAMASAQWLVDHYASPSTVRAWWLNESSGMRQPIRSQSTFRVNISQAQVHPHIRELVGGGQLSHALIVVNTGHWFRSYRSDVTFLNATGAQALDHTERLKFFEHAITVLAGYLQRKLDNSSRAIFRGHSPPGPTTPRACNRTVQEWSVPVLRGLRNTACRADSNVHILDTACALSSLPSGEFQGSHLWLPGGGDIGVTFLTEFLLQQKQGLTCPSGAILSPPVRRIDVGHGFTHVAF